MVTGGRERYCHKCSGDCRLVMLKVTGGAGVLLSQTKQEPKSRCQVDCVTLLII